MVNLLKSVMEKYFWLLEGKEIRKKNFFQANIQEQFGYERVSIIPLVENLYLDILMLQNLTWITLYLDHPVFGCNYVSKPYLDHPVFGSSYTLSYSNQSYTLFHTTRIYFIKFYLDQPVFGYTHVSKSSCSIIQFN